nr:uncharacterized protein LOC117279921 [Nicotiana tomentosiformis]
MALFEALYDQRYRSLIGWFDPVEVRLYGTDMVKDTLDKVKLIQECHCTTESKQRSYTDKKTRDLSLMVGDKVLLKVPPMKSIMRFGKRIKLSPRFLSPFEVLEQVGEVAYRLALPPRLSGVHVVFHMSMLRKYHIVRSQLLDYSTVQIDESLSYEEEHLPLLRVRFTS